MSEKAYVFFLRFQGSKGDPGMTGPTGAAGLPVSLVGSEAALHLPWSPPRSTAKTEHPEPGAENPGPSDSAQFCGGGSSRQPLAHALELPRRAPLEANPGAHGPC